MTGPLPPPPPAAPPVPPPPPATAPVVVVDRVSKWFRDVVALSDVSFAIYPGVTALLGPNGAGKSTMMRILCGLTRPSQGAVRVLGRNPKTDVELSRHIGLAPQQEGVFEALAPFEFVRLGAVLHGLDDPEGAAAAALATVELDPSDSRRTITYSKGMRQRVKLAQALVHDPEVLVLDEPLTGLDPKQRRRMIALVQQLGDAGKCVIISSHVLDEVERFGSRVLVLAQGRLAAMGDYHAIRNLMDDRPHRIRISTDRPRAMATSLIDAETVMGVTLQTDDTLLIETREVSAFRHGVAEVARRNNARLYEVVPLDDDLESVFRYLVGSG
ncbi:MAG: Vitamin B12 import ATP-binding protein BtuD [Acidimicrobiales bacterium]|nr:MAG: ABC transporter ATP-binding protein [Actinomycetota bacterium]MBV6509300.1 Vitamin B12 import ATP-binding protein BtuD [Acidimicrobiales bacterium]RIK03975.1 MAG: ABC transporter [Acidobacteriota bacterium]